MFDISSYSQADIALYLLGINAFTVLIYWWDKFLAKKNASFRIPEITLLLAALMGGSPAAFAAMKFFRHKTRKGSFRVKFWLVVLIQVGMVFWYISGALSVLSGI